jgi:hypothetical protein
MCHEQHDLYCSSDVGVERRLTFRLSSNLGWARSAISFSFIT